MSKQIPEFKNEDEERAFWATHDSSEYVDWSKSQEVLAPNLKPSTRSISLSLPASLLDELRQMANQRDVPYQSLIKIFLSERIDMERQRNFAMSEGTGSYDGKNKLEAERRKKETRKKLQ
jgi:predicted DNA binding CopG/RHH family protein